MSARSAKRLWSRRHQAGVELIAARIFGAGIRRSNAWPRSFAGSDFGGLGWALVFEIVFRLFEIMFRLLYFVFLVFELAFRPLNLCFCFRISVSLFEPLLHGSNLGIVVRICASLCEFVLWIYNFLSPGASHCSNACFRSRIYASLPEHICLFSPYLD